MGKIRVKTLGEDALEEEQKKRDDARRATKRAKKEGDQQKTKTPSAARSDERIASVVPSEKEIEKAEKEIKRRDFDESPTVASIPKETKKESKEEKTETKHKKQVSRPEKPRSHRYQELKALVDRNKLYELDEALSLVLKTSKTSFAGSIEAHINLRKTAKELSLKTPKKSKAQGADATVSPSLNISFEKKQAVAHTILGKTTAKVEDLKSQYEAIVKFINPVNITKITLSSSMGPGIKVKLQ